MVQGYLKAIPVNVIQDVNGIYKIGFVQPAGDGQSSAEMWQLVAPRLSETEARQLSDVIEASALGAKLFYSVTIDFRMTNGKMGAKITYLYPELGASKYLENLKDQDVEEAR